MLVVTKLHLEGVPTEVYERQIQHQDHIPRHHALFKCIIDHYSIEDGLDHLWDLEDPCNLLNFPLIEVWVKLVSVLGKRTRWLRSAYAFPLPPIEVLPNMVVHFFSIQVIRKNHYEDLLSRNEIESQGR